MMTCQFNTPTELFEQAKTRILHQDDALRQLCVLMYYHLKHLSIQRYPTAFANTAQTPPTYTRQPPVFLVGKTGSGKTHLVKELCQLVGINFVCVNCTHLSNSGYKGMNIADIGRQLDKTASDELALQHSVVFLDEFDKLFVGSHAESNYVEYNRMLSAELLTLIEGTTAFPIKGDNDKDEKHIESKNMLFILGGSFGMHEPNTHKIAMGFTTKTNPRTALPQNQKTLTDFGLPAELAGRIGKIIQMQHMDNTMMKDILLHSPTSPYQSFCGQLSLEGCTAELDESLLDGLIEAQQEAIDKFGVRGLYQGFYELPQIIDTLLDAPSHHHHHYTITPDGFAKEHRPPPEPTSPPQGTIAEDNAPMPRVTEFFYDENVPI